MKTGFDLFNEFADKFGEELPLDGNSMRLVFINLLLERLLDVFPLIPLIHFLGINGFVQSNLSRALLCLGRSVCDLDSLGRPQDVIEAVHSGYALVIDGAPRLLSAAKTKFLTPFVRTGVHQDSEQVRFHVVKQKGFALATQAVTQSLFTTYWLINVHLDVGCNDTGVLNIPLITDAFDLRRPLLLTRTSVVATNLRGELDDLAVRLRGSTDAAYYLRSPLKRLAEPVPDTFLALVLPLLAIAEALDDDAGAGFVAAVESLINDYARVQRLHQDPLEYRVMTALIHFLEMEGADSLEAVSKVWLGISDFTDYLNETQGFDFKPQYVSKKLNFWGLLSDADKPSLYLSDPTSGQKTRKQPRQYRVEPRVLVGLCRKNRLDGPPISPTQEATHRPSAAEEVAAKYLRKASL